MLDPAFIDHLNLRLREILSPSISISRIHAVHGGDINDAYLLVSSEKNFFLKVNDASVGEDMFEKETLGLSLLSNSQSVHVPLPLFHGSFHGQIYLLMNFLEKGQPKPDFWEQFGKSIAELHKNNSSSFGLDHDNYIGRFLQSNQKHRKWEDFYAQERIMKPVLHAHQKQLLSRTEVESFEILCKKLGDIFGSVSASLVHGDLWSGNFMVGLDGNAIIYDPAVYYGHREMDLAMSRLFGGFDRRFYEAYHYYYPLEPGFRERIEICQLYPLLIHLILFRGHYYHDLLRVLDKYQ